MFVLDVKGWRLGTESVGEDVPYDEWRETLARVERLRTGRRESSKSIEGILTWIQDGEVLWGSCKRHEEDSIYCRR